MGDVIEKDQPEPSDRHTISFLPWVHLSKAYTFGRHTFWPWPEEAEQRIPDKNLRFQVEVILSAYRKYHEYPVDQVTVIESGTSSLSLIDPIEHHERIMSLNLLAFCCLAANDYLRVGGLGSYGNMAAFELISQNFVEGSDGVSFSTRRRDGSVKDAGHRSTQLRNNAPPWVKNCKVEKIDEGLTTALSSVANSEQRKHRRIRNAVEWFLYSFTDSPTMSPAVEIACLHAAFEHLDGKKLNTDWIAKVFEGYSVLGPETVVGEETAPYATWKEAWARSFIDCRNDHLHGELNPPTQRWNAFWHIYIGTIAFVFAVRVFLERMSLYAFTDEDRVTGLMLDRFIADPEPDSWEKFRSEARMELVTQRVMERLREVEQIRVDAGESGPVIDLS